MVEEDRKLFFEDYYGVISFYKQMLIRHRCSVFQSPFLHLTLQPVFLRRTVRYSDKSLLYEQRPLLQTPEQIRVLNMVADNLGAEYAT
jgi:hypothetical protein